MKIDSKDFMTMYQDKPRQILRCGLFFDKDLTFSREFEVSWTESRRRIVTTLSKIVSTRWHTNIVTMFQQIHDDVSRPISWYGKLFSHPICKSKDVLTDDTVFMIFLVQKIASIPSFSNFSNTEELWIDRFDKKSKELEVFVVDTCRVCYVTVLRVHVVWMYYVKVFKTCGRSMLSLVVGCVVEGVVVGRVEDGLRTCWGRTEDVLFWCLWGVAFSFVFFVSFWTCHARVSKSFLYLHLSLQVVLRLKLLGICVHLRVGNCCELLHMCSQYFRIISSRRVESVTSDRALILHARFWHTLISKTRTVGPSQKYEKKTNRVWQSVLMRRLFRFRLKSMETWWSYTLDDIELMIPQCVQYNETDGREWSGSMERQRRTWWMKTLQKVITWRSTSWWRRRWTTGRFLIGLEKSN